MIPMFQCFVLFIVSLIRWFDGFDWEAVRKRTLTPPILPCVRQWTLTVIAYLFTKQLSDILDCLLPTSSSLNYYFVCLFVCFILGSSHRISRAQIASWWQWQLITSWIIWLGQRFLMCTMIQSWHTTQEKECPMFLNVTRLLHYLECFCNWCFFFCTCFGSVCSHMAKDILI